MNEFTQWFEIHEDEVKRNGSNVNEEGESGASVSAAG